jgi:1-acyl-sn-glycerol-3-phosphate acyltransferase
MFTSLVLLLVLPLYTFLAGMVAIPYALLSGSNSLIYRLGRLGLRIGFAITRTPIRAHGLENLTDAPHFIYMMNHSSNLDVPAVYMYLPGQVRVLGKKELFHLPVLGTAMRLAGFFPVDRRDRTRAIASVKQAAEVARSGESFLIAPEGTRSRDGRLLPFKKGGFYMAIDSGVPILPITVRGVHELMPPGAFAIRSGPIDVFFHEPVRTTGLRYEDSNGLLKEVRRRIARSLEPGPDSADDGPSAGGAGE